MNIVECRDVKKVYHQGHLAVTALDGITLAIEQGGFVALAGPSGSGKTTLLNIIGGLDRADEGSVTLDGNALGEMSEAMLAELRLRKVGFVFQSFNLIPVLSAVENVEFGMLLQGVPAAERRQRAWAMLDDVGLAGLYHRRPSELSGGQQQRVSIVRALALKPEVLFFDEPTSALDPELTGEVLKVIRSLTEEHMTMVIVTHEMAFARQVANRVYFMDEGAVVEQGTPDEVFGRPQEERTRRFLERYTG